MFDATGSKVSMQASFNLVAHGGRCVFVGHYPGELSFHEPEFHRRELTLMASRNGTHKDFMAVIRLLEQGAADVTGLITHRYAFDEVLQVFPHLSTRRGVIKVLIAMP